jgi:rare lipoprotein A
MAARLTTLFLLLLTLIWIGGCAQRNVDFEGRKFPIEKEIRIPPTAPSQSPYVVGGHLYMPMQILILGWTERGIASWYGTDFHNRPTASGEIYNMYDYTAAHKTLPLGTVVRVTNLANKKSIVVLVNDRGPFVANRIIDLSYSAAKALGLDTQGIGKVELQIIGYKPPKRVASILSPVGVTETGFAGLSSLQQLYAHLERKSMWEKFKEYVQKKVEGLINQIKSVIPIPWWHSNTKTNPKIAPVKGAVPSNLIPPTLPKGEKLPQKEVTPLPQGKKINRKISTPTPSPQGKKGVKLKIGTFSHKEYGEALLKKMERKGYQGELVKKGYLYNVILTFPSMDALRKFEIKEKIKGVPVE